MKILVMAAHPDDEVLGVGGAICRHISNGDEVYVCVATKPYEPQWSSADIAAKTQEQKEVDKLLGIKKRFNLDLPTVRLNTIATGDFSKKISDIVDLVDPDIIYTHFEGDLNHDHTLVFQATLVAARPPKRIRLVCYETLSETEWGNMPFLPNMWVDVSRFIEKKKAAFQLYRTEIKKHPHPRSADGIEILARRRGIEACVEYAEAFVLLRDVMR
ncbi:MAG: PIG-L family deacetylase [Candidatus Aenigmarchaeota archaeon]|nr:PIG-L family deacetylase [Candidatus Aenigmarchaeota archaeon]